MVSTRQLCEGKEIVLNSYVKANLHRTARSRGSTVLSEKMCWMHMPWGFHWSKTSKYFYKNAECMKHEPSLHWF